MYCKVKRNSLDLKNNNIRVDHIQHNIKVYAQSKEKKGVYIQVVRNLKT